MQPIALKAAIVPLVVGLQKPSQKSNAKDHQECLSRRLVLWKEGEVDKLLREERMIQKRLSNSRRVDPLNAGRVSANLVMSGQINSALRYLSENDREGWGGVLPQSDDVIAQLRGNIQVHRKLVWVLCFSGQSKMSQTQFTNS